MQMEYDLWDSVDLKDYQRFWNTRNLYSLL